MKKYFLAYEKDGSISCSEMEVEQIFRPAWEYRTPNEHAFKIISSKYAGEIWYWWAFASSKKEAEEQAQKMFNERLMAQLRNFFRFLDLVTTDRLSEWNKWRL